MSGWTPIYCFDFDGVLHSYLSGWKGAHVIPDRPVPGAIEYLVAAIDAGFKVHIFSSRSKSPRGRWAMKEWVRRWARFAFTHELLGKASIGFVYDDAAPWEKNADDFADHLARRLHWPWFKPSAFVTLDDRAITFNGTFPDLASVRAFKPWNKR